VRELERAGTPPPAATDFARIRHQRIENHQPSRRKRKGIRPASKLCTR
jgi:hypothetical protein